MDNTNINQSRKINSAQEPLYWGDEHDQRGVNMYTREEYIEKYGEEPPEWKRVTEVETDLWNSRRPIESARFIIEDENGFVIAEADTYEEAKSVGGTTIIDTQKQIQSSADFDKVRELSHEIAKKILSDEISMEEALATVQKELNCNESYAAQCISTWLENEPTYNGMTMTSSSRMAQGAPMKGYVYSDSLDEMVPEQFKYKGKIYKWYDPDCVWYNYERDDDYFMEVPENAEIIESSAIKSNAFEDWGIVDDDFGTQSSANLETYEDEFYDMVEENGYDINEKFTYMAGVTPDVWTPEDTYIAATYELDVPGYYKLGDQEGMVLVGTLKDIYDYCDEHWGMGLAEDYVCPADSFDYEDGEWVTGHWIDSSLEDPEWSARKPKESVQSSVIQNYLEGKLSEDAAIRTIASTRKCNIGYARKIFQSWIKIEKPKLIKSGLYDMAEDLNKEWNPDGTFESWTKDFVPDSGKAATVGGEILRAANRIIGRWINDGDRVGVGYGRETCNPAARYLIKMGVADEVAPELEEMIAGEFQPEDYDSWIYDFQSNIQDYLYDDMGELFKKPNKEDFYGLKEDSDEDNSVDSIEVTDYDGNTYIFSHQGENDWLCEEITLGNSDWNVDDTFIDGDEIADEVDNEVEFGTFIRDGYTYDWEALDEPDEDGYWHEWKITGIAPEDGLCQEGEAISGTEILGTGYEVVDTNGNYITEQQLKN